MKSYKALEQRFRRIAGVNGALAMLGWDQSVMMPEGGAKVRGEQMAVLSVVRHEWLTDPAVGASTWASGSQVCTGHIDSLTAKEARKANHSQACISRGKL